MKRILVAAVLLVSIPLSLAAADYVVILKNGRRYKAAQKWQLVDGKAVVRLQNGTTIQLDPALIDVRATDQANRSGLGDAQVIATTVPSSEPTVEPTPSALGNLTRLRDRDANSKAQQGVAGSGSNVGSVSASGNVPQAVLDRYRNAFENLGYYDASIKATSNDTLKIELVADNEQQVFNALTATAYLMEKMPEATGVNVRQVDLDLLTLRGGYAGRFKMDREDSAAIEAKKITPQIWFVENVIF